MIDFMRGWWPPSQEDSERLRDYKRREQLFESDHKTAFADKSAKLPDHLKEKAYLVQDYPKMVSTVYADLLFAEPPIFSLPGQQEEIDQLVTSNMLATLFYESELSISFRGDAVFKVGMRPRHPGGEPEIIIEEKPASSYFVELDPDNARQVLSQCLAWERCVGDGERKKEYLVVEHHLPGQIITQLYLRTGHTKIKMQVPLSDLYGDAAPPEVQFTGVPMPLLFHFPNLRHGSRYWGMSDYTEGLESLFNSANQRLTSISDILDKHESPKLVMPAYSLDKKGNLKAASLDVIEVNPEDSVSGAPRYLTWDPQLAAAFGMLEANEEKIFQFADISPAMFGKDKAGNIESGRAMAMRFARMMTRVGRKRSYREPIIKQMLFAAQLLKQAWLNGPAPLGPVEIIWRNGLPKDDLELTNVAKAQVEAGIMSRHSAIRYVKSVSPIEADTELARIKEEQSSGAPPVAPAIVQPPA
jgi:hypothetical protein